MQEVGGFLSGETDYMNLKGIEFIHWPLVFAAVLLKGCTIAHVTCCLILKRSGDTGPLVYPAGFVYLYSAFYWITSQVYNVHRLVS